MPRFETESPRVFALARSLRLSKQIEMSNLMTRFANLGLIVVVVFYFIATGEWTSLSHQVWVLVYSCYAVLAEFLRWKLKQRFDTFFFQMLRIQVNLLMITWLVAMDRSATIFFWFLYVWPLFAAILFFKELKWQFIVFAECMVGLFVGVILFPKPQFGMVDYATICVMLFSVFVVLPHLLFGQHFSDTTREFHRTLDLLALLELVVNKTIQWTGASQADVIVIDPVTGRRMGHFLGGHEFRPGRTADELAKECSVIKSGKPFEASDLAAKFGDRSLYQQYFVHSPRSVIAKPLFTGNGQVLGVLGISCDEPRKFDSRIGELMEFIALQASSAIENSLHYTLTRQREERQAKLNEIWHRLMEAPDEAGIGDILVHSAHELVTNVEGSELHHYSARRDNLVLWGALPPHSSQLGKTKMSRGIGIAGAALASFEVQYADDAENDRRFVPSANGQTIRSIMAAPLYLTKDTPFGTLSVHSSRANAFDQADREILKNLADFGASAIANRQITRHRQLLARVLADIQRLDVGLGDEEFGKQVVQAAAQNFGFKRSRLRILNQPTQELRTVAVFGVSDDTAAELLKHRVLRSDLSPLFREQYRIGNCFLIDHDPEVWKEVPSDAFYRSDSNTESPQPGWHPRDSLIAPLIAPGGEWQGLLTWDAPSSGEYPSSEVIEAIQVFANALAGVIVTRANYARVVEKERNVREFIQSLGGIVRGGNLSAVGRMIVQAGANLLDAEGCSLYLVKDKNTELAFSTHLEGTHFIGRAKPVSDQPGAGLTAHVAATCEPLNLYGDKIKKHRAWAGEDDHDQLGYLESGECKSLLMVAVLDQHSHCVAVLKVENKEGPRADEGFDGQDRSLLELIAQQVAIAIEVTNWRETYGKYWIYQGLEDDLHEIISLFHSGVFLRIESVLKWLEMGDINKALELMPKLKEYAHTGIKELRAIHSITRSPVLESEGLMNELQKLAQVWEMQMVPSMRINLDCRITHRLPSEVEYSLYRVAQCALANAATHSMANMRPDGQINLELWQEENAIILRVQDNGVGFDKQQKESQGYGLNRMKHWADQIKARLGIETEAGCGTSVTARVALGGETL